MKKVCFPRENGQFSRLLSACNSGDGKITGFAQMQAHTAFDARFLYFSL